MTTQTLQIPLKDYATGERTLESAIPANVRSIKLTLQRCTTATPTIWPQHATFVNLELFGSFDGGATWIEMGAWGAFGGIFIRRDGSEAQISEATFPWPGGGIAHAEFTIDNGPCRTQGSITLNTATA